MTNNFEHNIDKAKKGVALSAAEKEEMRSEFHAFLDAQKEPSKAAISPYHFFFVHRYAMAVFALLILGAGTSATAAYSLPGDTLYSMKVNVNEKVYEAVSFTPEMKARVHTELASTRLEELQTVILEKHSDPELINDLKENLEEHTETALETLDELKEHGNEEEVIKASLRLQTVLETHEEIIENLDSSSTDTKEEEAALDTIQLEISEQSDDVQDVVETVASSTASTTSIEEKETIQEAQTEANIVKDTIKEDAVERMQTD